MTLPEARELSQIDLVFCVDLTSSMTPFIDAAKAHMTNILATLASSADADLRVGVVGYRDYGSRETIEAYPLESNLEDVRRLLGQLQVWSPPENTDAAEAVFAGLQAACQTLQWRDKAYRVVVLVGDAPPHACGTDRHPYPDRYPEADPTGLTLMAASGRVETARITLHALGMLPSIHPVYDDVVRDSFEYLARSTGGTFRVAQSSADAMEVVRIIGRRVFGELAFDRLVFQRVQDIQRAAAPVPGAPQPAPAMMARQHRAEVAEALHVSEVEVDKAFSRLEKRQILAAEQDPG